MKVLIISAAFPPMAAGEATNAYHMCQRLADRGLDVHVLTSEGHTALDDSRVTVHPIMRSWSWSEVPRFLSFIRECAPDVVYLMYIGWMYHHQFMSTFLPTLAKRVLPDVSFVTRFENISGAYATTNSLVSRVIRKGFTAFDGRQGVDYTFGTLLRDSDTIVVLSERHGVTLESSLPGVGKKTVLMPPPVNMHVTEPGAGVRARGREALGVADGDFLLAYIGYIYAGKGIESLLRAVHQVRFDRPNVKLAIIGGLLSEVEGDHSGYLQGLRALAAELGLEQAVVWTGEYSFDGSDASMYFRGADACVLPFDYGVQLNNSSFSSAAAHGLPIITTIEGPAERQFVHGANLLLCPPKSPESLTAAIKSVMDDRGLRERLGDGSYALSQEWYSWDRAVDKTVEILGATPVH